MTEYIAFKIIKHGEGKNEGLAYIDAWGHGMDGVWVVKSKGRMVELDG